MSFGTSEIADQEASTPARERIAHSNFCLTTVHMGNKNSSEFGSSSTAEQVTHGIDLTGKYAIVTGANVGIGKETARVLAMRGATVIVGCRDQNRGQAAVTDILNLTGVENDKVTFMSLDLGSFDSIRAFAEAFLAKDIPLHLLICNAGVMLTPWGQTQEGFETQFGVNHVGHFLLVSLLIEKLKSSTPARVVVLSSIGHTIGDKSVLKLVKDKKQYNSYKAYGNSKLANLLFASELNRRLQGTGVSSNSVHPGSVHTDLGRSSKLASIFYTLSPFNKTIPQGAATTCFVATNPSVDPSTSGQYYADCKPKKPSSEGTDQNLAVNLWELTEELIGSKFLPQDGAPTLIEH